MKTDLLYQVKVLENLLLLFRDKRQTSLELRLRLDILDLLAELEEWDE